MSELRTTTAILSFLKNLFPLSHHDRVVLVGGMVRDILLGLECRDIDLVAALSADELGKLGFRLVEASSSAAIYFKHHHQFGTLEVTLITGMTDLEIELRRRDLTINAIAMTLSGTLIDPMNGAADVRNGVLRACSNVSFSADPLRVFRVFRFEAAGWRMTADTETQIREIDCSPAYPAMPVERFSNEMLKALAQKQPERFFQLMIAYNAGTEFLPELFRMPFIPAGPLEHHPEGDLFVHSTQVLQRVAATTDSPLTRFCAFFHDLGKLATNPALYPRHHGHDTAGFSMAVDFCNRLALPATYRKTLAWVSSLHGKANLWDELRDSTKLAMAARAIQAGIIDILPTVAAADKPGGLPMPGWGTVVQVAGMSTKELGIDTVHLEAMRIKDRPSFIQQKRLQVLKILAASRKD